MMVDFDSSLLDHWHLLQLCVSAVTELAIAFHLARDRLQPIRTRQLLVFVFKQHVVNRRKTDTCAQDVVDARSLAKQCVDERSAARHKWSLAQEAQD